MKPVELEFDLAAELKASSTASMNSPSHALQFHQLQWLGRNAEDTVAVMCSGTLSTIPAVACGQCYQAVGVSLFQSW